jgi:hypothetical protein
MVFAVAANDANIVAKSAPVIEDFSLIMIFSPCS